MGVGRPHDGEVDGEHVRPELGEAPPRRSEGGEEELLDENLVSLCLTPEEEYHLVGVSLHREGEHRTQHIAFYGHPHRRDTGMAVSSPV